MCWTKAGYQLGPLERRLPVFPLVQCKAFPGSHAIPAPAPCPLFPLPLAWPVNSEALAFTRLAAAAFNGHLGHRRAASGCRATVRQAAHVAARAETHPHQPVWAASLWPDFSLSIVVANTKGYNSSVVTGSALNYTPGHSSGQSLCGLGRVPSRCQNSGPVTRKLKQAWANCLPTSLPSPHPPTYRLCSFQLAARLSFAFWRVWDHSSGGLGHSSPLASFSLKLSAAYKKNPRPIQSSFLISFSVFSGSPHPSKFLRLLLPWYSNNLRDEGSFSLVSAKLPKLQRLKSALSLWGLPTLPCPPVWRELPLIHHLYSPTQCSTSCSDSGKFNGELGRET